MSNESVEGKAVSDFGIVRSGKTGPFPGHWRHRTLKTRLAIALRSRQGYVTGRMRSHTGNSGFILIAKRVGPLVVPVLDGMLRLQGQSVETPKPQRDWDRMEKRFYALLDNKCAEADEALVVLLHFYVGEHTSEDLLDEIAARGRRMLPYLPKNRHRVPRISGREYPDSMRTLPVVRNDDFDSVIRHIRDGRKATEH